MKNDLYKVKTVSREMWLNDLLYRKMQSERELLEEDILCGEEGTLEEKLEALRKHDFYSRVLSVTSGYDIPERAVIGLLTLNEILAGLYEKRNGYIGESDADVDILMLLLEYGYRLYDSLETGGSGEEGVHG